MTHLTIVPAYHGMTRYVTAARLAPPAEWEKLWEEHVIDAYWSQWAAGEFNEARTRAQLSRPYTDLDGLAAETAALEASGVAAIVAAAYDRIAQALPYHDGPAAVCILAADPQDSALVSAMNGVVGACVGGNTLLTINPAGVDWPRWAGYVLAHERHHSAWGYHYFFVRQAGPPSLLTSLISEGAADAFAHLLYPGLAPGWVNAIPPAEEARQWAIIQAHLHTPYGESDDLHARFFFGSPADGTPAGTGYTIGFHLVQSYLRRHPQASIADWTTQDPRAILAESGYQP